MAKTYRVTFAVRLVNRLMAFLLRLGLRVQTTTLLTVRGRKSGQPRTVPVTIIERDHQRWLVAPYGVVNWVKNVRETKRATLTRGKYAEIITLVEEGPEEAAPILKQYLTEVPFVRPYFQATPQASLHEFAAEAPAHPVFRIEDMKQE